MSEEELSDENSKRKLVSSMNELRKAFAKYDKAKKHRRTVKGAKKEFQSKTDRLDVGFNEKLVGFDNSIQSDEKEMAKHISKMKDEIENVKKIRSEYFGKNLTTYPNIDDNNLDDLISRLGGDVDLFVKHKTKKYPRKGEIDFISEKTTERDFNKEIQKLEDIVMLLFETDIKSEFLEELLVDIFDDEKLEKLKDVKLNRVSKKRPVVEKMNKEVQALSGYLLNAIDGKLKIKTREIPLLAKPLQMLLKVMDALLSSFMVKPILLPFFRMLYNDLYQRAIKPLFKGPKHFVSGMLKIGLTTGLTAGVGYGLFVGGVALGVVGILTPPIVFGVPVVLAVAGLWASAVVVANVLKKFSKVINKCVDRLLNPDSENFSPSKNEKNKEAQDFESIISHEDILRALEKEKVFYAAQVLEEKKIRSPSFGVKLKLWLKFLSPGDSHVNKSMTEREWVARENLKTIEKWRGLIQKSNPTDLNGYIKDIESTRRTMQTKVVRDFLHEKKIVHNKFLVDSPIPSSRNLQGFDSIVKINSAYKKGFLLWI